MTCSELPRCFAVFEASSEVITRSMMTTQQKVCSMDIIQTLYSLLVNLWTLGEQLFQLGVGHALLIVWVAWWLGAVNWKKAWPILARGGWVPVTLLVVVGAFVWSRIAASDCNCLGFVVLPNFWWQLGAAGALVGVALFCGWLQTYFDWSPAEISLEPAPVEHDAHH